MPGAPVATLRAPVASGASYVASSKTLASLAGSTSVSFYATAGDGLQSGRPIGTATVANGLLAVDAQGNFVATLGPIAKALKPGTYDVYAVVSDAEGVPVVSARSSTPLVVATSVVGSVTHEDGAPVGRSG